MNDGEKEGERLRQFIPGLPWVTKFDSNSTETEFSEYLQSNLGTFKSRVIRILLSYGIVTLCIFIQHISLHPNDAIVEMFSLWHLIFCFLALLLIVLSIKTKQLPRRSFEMVICVLFAVFVGLFAFDPSHNHYTEYLPRGSYLFAILSLFAIPRVSVAGVCGMVWVFIQFAMAIRNPTT
eukprot:PhF_6_TR29429/c0_g1_i2/m.43564